MHLQFPCKKSGLPIICKSEFDDLAEQILEKYMPDVLEFPKAVDIRYLAENCIVVDILEEDLCLDNLLGFITFADMVIPISGDKNIKVTEGTIILDISLHQKITRWRFTVAHELAHWILHRAYHCGDKRVYNFRVQGYSYIACRTDKSELGKKNPRVAKTDDEWAEWQADNLAAALLMPKTTFIYAARQILCKYGFEELLLISGKDVNKGMQVVRELADIFQVSMRAVRIRMRTFGMYEGDAKVN